MKTPSMKNLIVAALAVASLACSPALRAQTPAPVTSQDTKMSDSTAQQNAPANGTPTQTAAQQDTNTKDTSASLDKNPSNASTDSAQTSGTKDSNGTTTNESMASDKSDKSSDAMSDRSFIMKAAQGGMTEVELGKLAQQNGSSAEVKDFGSKMVTEHSQANDQLKALAEKKGITVPSELNAKNRAAVEHFRSLSGAAFDKAYVHAMVKDHEKDASEFRKASESAQDSDVKAFASDGLKMVEMHLSDIKSIQGNMK